MLKIRLDLRKVAAIVGCLALTTMFSGCDDKETQPEIKVENAAALSQTAYADQTSGSGGVKIVTTGAWTSTITEGAAKSTKSGAATWLSIAPSSGASAGEYTIVITLETNASGETRSATITIKCGDTEISIVVTQQATKENGEPYVKAPTLTTTTATNITSTSATTGGNITEAGTPPYTERGVCYGTTANPTVADNKIAVAGNGIGDFATELTNLIAETKYYVRAYATGSAGTVYGNQVEFTTEAEGFTFEEVSHNFVKREGTTFYDNHYVVKVNGVQKDFTIEVDRYSLVIDYDVSDRYDITMTDLSLDDVELLQGDIETSNWIGSEVPGPYYIDMDYRVYFRDTGQSRISWFQGKYRRVTYRVVADANEKIDLPYYTWEFEKIGITYGATREVDREVVEGTVTFYARTADVKFRVKFGSETFEITLLFDVYVRK